MYQVYAFYLINKHMYLISAFKSKATVYNFNLYVSLIIHIYTYGIHMHVHKPTTRYNINT